MTHEEAKKMGATHQLLFSDGTLHYIKIGFFSINYWDSEKWEKHTGEVCNIYWLFGWKYSHKYIHGYNFNLKPL